MRYVTHNLSAIESATNRREQDVWFGDDGRVYRKPRWGVIAQVNGLYVHPVTRLLCCKPERRSACRDAAFLHAQTALQSLGMSASTARDIRRYRVDGLRVWEQRDSGWFIHTYRLVPEQLIRMIIRTDWREVPIYESARYERVATKQASKNEIRGAQRLLQRDPLAGDATARW